MLSQILGSLTPEHPVTADYDHINKQYFMASYLRDDNTECVRQTFITVQIDKLCGRAQTMFQTASKKVYAAFGTVGKPNHPCRDKVVQEKGYSAFCNHFVAACKFAVEQEPILISMRECTYDCLAYIDISQALPDNCAASKTGICLQQTH